MRHENGEKFMARGTGARPARCGHTETSIKEQPATMATSAAYILFLTLFLTEGGTLEAEQDIDVSSLQECRREARRQQEALRREFTLSVEERGMCPFRDVKVVCQKKKDR